MLAPREVDEYLLPTERRVIRVRQHWAVMASNVVQTGLFLLLMVGLKTYLPVNIVIHNLTFYLSLAAVVRFSVQTILWWIERIVVTDKRVMRSEGFINHKVGMMPLTKVTDLSFDRSLGGRIFGYGTLMVESAGQDQAFREIDFIPRPEEVYEALSELVFGEKGRTRAVGTLPRARLRR
jgi:uncharacterized membrane protein YdbT with pleckstrin-like domain